MSHHRPHPADTAAISRGEVSPRRFDNGVWDIAERCFEWLVTGPQPVCLHGRRVHHVLADRAMPLDELRDVIFTPGVGGDVRDAVCKQLLTRARAGDPVWILAAVGVAMPALRRAAAAGPETGVDTPARVLARFRDAICAEHLDLDQPALLDRLCHRAGDTRAANTRAVNTPSS